MNINKPSIKIFLFDCIEEYFQYYIKIMIKTIGIIYVQLIPKKKKN